MALPATGVYEVRVSATANNVNGGGFNSARGGTDYTLQDAAQLTRADGTAAGGTTFGSVLGGFTDAMKGNYIHLTASTGLTVGWYEIVSVVDANNVELDRTPGTGSATTFYVGGAMSLNSTLDDDLFETSIAGNKFWIKAGAYTLGETVAIGAAGTAAAKIVIEGYNSTRGDAPSGSSRPSLAAGAGTWTTGAFWWVYNVIFTGTGTPVVTTGGTSNYINCKSTNSSTTTTRTAFQLGSNALVENCEAISYRGYAVNPTGSSGCSVRYNYIHDSDEGIRTGHAVDDMIIGNIIADNVTAAVRINTAVAAKTSLLSNTLYGSQNKLGIGLSIVTGTTVIHVVNNILYGFVTGVNHADAAHPGYDDYNCFNNNTTNATNWTLGPHTVTTNPAFTSVAQLTGATATTSGSVLTQSGGDFSTVTDNVDFVYIVSGTGITVGKYLITSHTATTITLDIAPGTSATADKVWQITTSKNFLPTGAI